MKHLGSIIMLLMTFSAAAGQDRILSLDDIYGAKNKIDFDGEDLPKIEWDKSGEYLIKTCDYEKGLFFRINPVDGTEENLVDRAVLLDSLAALPGFSVKDAEEALKKAEYTLSPAGDKILIQASRDLFLFDLQDGGFSRLTNSPVVESAASFSPSGEQAAWVRDGDIFVTDLSSGAERQLTEKTDENILNGYLDWVYQEEVYGRGDFKAYWWSPDSRYIAFLQLDVSDEPVYLINDDRTPHSEVEKQRYPHPGDSNASPDRLLCP
jgi:dipeptidyl-peptidase-4